MQTIEANITLKKPRKRRRRLRPFYLFTVSLLAAVATTRAIVFAVDLAQQRMYGPGGEILVPAAIVALIYFGWTLRGIAEAIKKSSRKEKTPCGTTNATSAEQRLTLAKPATADRQNPRAGGKRLRKASGS